jgi:hypothetical protein
VQRLLPTVSYIRNFVINSEGKQFIQSAWSRKKKKKKKKKKEEGNELQ